MKPFITTALLLIAGLVRAADICVSTPEGFQQALNLAASNQEANHIMLVQEEYRATQSGTNFGFKWYHSSADPLVISGGWLLENNQCVEPSEPAEPRDTVINGGAFDRGFEVLVGAQDINLTLTNLFIKFGSSPPPIVGYLTRGAGIKIANINATPFGGVVVLDRLLLQDNYGVNAAALYVSGAEHLVVRNSAFFRNRASHYGGLLIEVPATGRLYFVNNTFRGNQTINTDPNPHVAAEFSGVLGSEILIANNIFWGNDYMLDVLLTGSDDAEIWLLNNHFNYLEGLVPDVDSDNFHNPVIEISNDYIPHIGSSYINAAFMPDPGQAGQFIHDWSPGHLDFMGQPRIHGGGLDISAGEESVLLVFKADFD